MNELINSNSNYILIKNINNNQEIIKQIIKKHLFLKDNLIYD
jgi:hypothetical protein